MILKDNVTPVHQQAVECYVTLSLISMTHKPKSEMF